MDIKWLLEIEEDSESGNLVLPFPPDMLEAVGWQEGDEITWTENEDGSWTLSKNDIQQS